MTPPSDHTETTRTSRIFARLRRVSWGSSLLLLGTMIGTGFLFGVAADHARSTPSTLGLDLPQLVQQRQGDIRIQEETLHELNSEINTLVMRVSTASHSSVERPWAMQTITGPGMKVELSDAPPDVITGAEVSANDLVVHQQDVDAVMNALWRGGAEAMAIQGIRISPSTPVRCIGNVILVGGSSFAPPYQIEAIGNPETLSQALDEDPQLRIYRQYVDAYGIGWKAETMKELTIPPLTDGYAFRYATP